VLPGERSYLSVDSPDLVVSAIKPTEYDRSGVVIRVFNPTDRPVEGTILLGFPHAAVECTDFREKRVRQLEGSGAYAVHLAPYEIATVKAVTGETE
jgi:alpha-mannosidase